MNGKAVLAAVVGLAVGGLVGGLLARAYWPSRQCDREPTDSTDAAEVRAALEAQAAAWNEDDLDRFMAGYRDGEELRYFSGGEVTKGRKVMHEFYRRRAEEQGGKLGKLTFSDVEVWRSGEWATAQGRWYLTRAGKAGEEKLEGVFTLLLRRFAEGWRIVHDHTSRSEQAHSAAEQEVLALLEAQEKAWNAGKLDEFMKGYWESEELTFYSADEVKKGYKGLQERYRKRYQENKQGMGKLTFSELDVEPVGAGWATARGRWKVEREKETLQGLFTLVLRRMPEGWRVVHDHTSAAEKKE